MAFLSFLLFQFLACYIYVSNSISFKGLIGSGVKQCKDTEEYLQLTKRLGAWEESSRSTVYQWIRPSDQKKVLVTEYLEKSVEEAQKSLQQKSHILHKLEKEEVTLKLDCVGETDSKRAFYMQPFVQSEPLESAEQIYDPKLHPFLVQRWAEWCYEATLLVQRMHEKNIAHLRLANPKSWRLLPSKKVFLVNFGSAREVHSNNVGDKESDIKDLRAFYSDLYLNMRKIEVNHMIQNDVNSFDDQIPMGQATVKTVDQLLAFLQKYKASRK